MSFDTLIVIGNSYHIKNAPRGMRTRAYKENVAFATALGARVRKRTLCSTFFVDVI